MKTRIVHCVSCDVLVINNVICHELGCPDAWKDELRTCPWCGQKFKPESKEQLFDCDDCANSYHGY
ncbi:MAG: hypothetical protein JXA46_11805 [Dehalococcoidales bacterium]|nr:hypothetical protein [Dehalococcoidales bacterium]